MLAGLGRPTLVKWFGEGEVEDRVVAEETRLFPIERAEEGVEGVSDLGSVGPLQADLGGPHGGIEVGEHRDLLVLVAQEEDRSDRARPANARRLLIDVIGLPRALEGEPAPPEAGSGHAALGSAAFQIRQEADVLGVEEPEGVGREAAAVKDQRKRPRAVDLADLGHRGGDRRVEGIIQRPGDKNSARPCASWT